MRIVSLRRFMTASVWFFLIGLLALQPGCDRNIEPFQPGEESKQPDLARIFPAPTGEGIGDGEAANAQSGRVARSALPPSRNEGANGGGSAPAGRGDAAPISGQIDLTAEAAASIPPGGVLFVIARPRGATGGPPLAVLRIPDPTFPFPFEIGPANVMIPSMQFAGEISLSARLDADGNAMTRGPGDVSSAVVEPLLPGATDVKLILSEQG